MGRTNQEADLTDDRLFDGRLVCRQHRHGYRFSLDAVLLAHFITPRSDDRIIDLGTGCGIVSLILAYRWPDITITALELQPELAALALENVIANGLEDRVRVVAGDFADPGRLIAAGAFDWAVSNPPYRKIESGRRNPGRQQAMARHEISGNLGMVIRAAKYGVRTRGRAAFIFPAARGAELITRLKNNNMEPKRLQVVANHPGAEGKLLLVEAVHGGGEELAILPPLHVYQAPGGEYSEEMARYYAP